MKKTKLVLIMLLAAGVASAATVGIMRFVESGGFAGGGAVTVISDERCKDCNTEMLVEKIKELFPGQKVEVLDYDKDKAKKLYDSEKLTGLPAVLLPKGIEKDENYTKVQRFSEPGTSYIVLKTGGKFDPKAEICDNEKDDNGDSKVDCDDPTCKSNWLCMDKKDKPGVEVFVMSHCPFGTQIEKGILPVWDLLGDKIDLNIRFCDYAMHGEKEVNEQLRQYCIQNMDKKKFRKYLGCFLKEGKTDDTCLKESGIDKVELTSCISDADKKYEISKLLGDKSKWKGRFPTFPVHADLAEKYEVRGSPTLVINEVRAQSVRSPKALLDAICTGFKNKPAECSVEIDGENPSPGFGFKKGDSTAEASCGS